MCLPVRHQHQTKGYLESCTFRSLPKLEVEPGPLLLHLGLPLPFERVVTLTTRSSNTLVDSAELQRHSCSLLAHVW